MSIVLTTNSERIQSIRRLVSVGFSPADLTDADITDDVFLGAANRYVIGKVPEWASLSADDILDLEVAVCKKCAAEMLRSVARVEEIDRSRARARMHFLAIQDTIEDYEGAVEGTIADKNPEVSGIAVPYFNVIVLGGDDYEDS